MRDKPTEIEKFPEAKIQVTDNLVQFFELLLKVDRRLEEQKRKEKLS